MAPLSDAIRARIINILKRNRTLTACEEALRRSVQRVTRPIAWGLHNGWNGLPESTAGLAVGDTKQANEYTHAYDLGAKLRREERGRKE